MVVSTYIKRGEGGAETAALLSGTLTNSTRGLLLLTIAYSAQSVRDVYLTIDKAFRAGFCSAPHTIKLVICLTTMTTSFVAGITPSFLTGIIPVKYVRANATHNRRGKGEDEIESLDFPSGSCDC